MGDVQDLISQHRDLATDEVNYFLRLSDWAALAYEYLDGPNLKYSCLLCHADERVLVPFCQILTFRGQVVVEEFAARLARECNDCPRCRARLCQIVKILLEEPDTTARSLYSLPTPQPVGLALGCLEFSRALILFESRHSNEVFTAPAMFVRMPAQDEQSAPLTRLEEAISVRTARGDPPVLASDAERIGALTFLGASGGGLTLARLAVQQLQQTPPRLLDGGADTAAMRTLRELVGVCRLALVDREGPARLRISRGYAMTVLSEGVFKAVAAPIKSGPNPPALDLILSDAALLRAVLGIALDAEGLGNPEELVKGFTLLNAWLRAGDEATWSRTRLNPTPYLHKTFQLLDLLIRRRITAPLQPLFRFIRHLFLFLPAPVPHPSLAWSASTYPSMYARLDPTAIASRCIVATLLQPPGPLTIPGELSGEARRHAWDLINILYDRASAPTSPSLWAHVFAARALEDTRNLPLLALSGPLEPCHGAWLRALLADAAALVEGARGTAPFHDVRATLALLPALPYLGRRGEAGILRLCDAAADACRGAPGTHKGWIGCPALWEHIASLPATQDGNVHLFPGVLLAAALCSFGVKPRPSGVPLPGAGGTGADRPPGGFFEADAIMHRQLDAGSGEDHTSLRSPTTRDDARLSNESASPNAMPLTVNPVYWSERLEKALAKALKGWVAEGLRHARLNRALVPPKGLSSCLALLVFLLPSTSAILRDAALRALCRYMDRPEPPVASLYGNPLGLTDASPDLLAAICCSSDDALKTGVRIGAELLLKILSLPRSHGTPRTPGWLSNTEAHRVLGLVAAVADAARDAKPTLIESIGPSQYSPSKLSRAPDQESLGSEGSLTARAASVLQETLRAVHADMREPGLTYHPAFQEGGAVGLKHVLRWLPLVRQELQRFCGAESAADALFAGLHGPVASSSNRELQSAWCKGARFLLREADRPRGPKLSKADLALLWDAVAVRSPLPPDEKRRITELLSQRGGSGNPNQPTVAQLLQFNNRFMRAPVKDRTPEGGSGLSDDEEIQMIGAERHERGKDGARPSSERPWTDRRPPPPPPSSSFDPLRISLSEDDEDVVIVEEERGGQEKVRAIPRAPIIVDPRTKFGLGPVPAAAAPLDRDRGRIEREAGAGISPVGGRRVTPMGGALPTATGDGGAAGHKRSRSPLGASTPLDHLWKEPGVMEGLQRLSHPGGVLNGTGADKGGPPPLKLQRTGGWPPAAAPGALVAPPPEKAPTPAWFQEKRIGALPEAKAKDRGGDQGRKRTLVNDAVGGNKPTRPLPVPAPKPAVPAAPVAAPILKPPPPPLVVKDFVRCILSWPYPRAIQEGQIPEVLLATPPPTKGGANATAATASNGPAPSFLGTSFQHVREYQEAVMPLILEELRAGIQSSFGDLEHPSAPSAADKPRGQLVERVEAGATGSPVSIPAVVDRYTRTSDLETLVLSVSPAAVSEAITKAGGQAPKRTGPPFRADDLVLLTLSRFRPIALENRQAPTLRGYVSTRATLTALCVKCEYCRGERGQDGSWEVELLCSTVVPPCFANGPNAESVKWSAHQVGEKLAVGSTWHATVVASLAPAMREISAVCKLAELPKRLLDPLLNSIRSVAPPSSSTPAAALWIRLKNHPRVGLALGSALESSFNKPQREAIGRAVLEPAPYVLIQGPPGTGKTKTILGLAAAFLAVDPPISGALQTPIPAGAPPEGNFARPQGAGPSSTAAAVRDGGRLLICTQSNAAADEIILRLAGQGIFRKSGRCEPLQPGALVRFGRLEAIHPDAQRFHIDRLFEDGPGGPEEAQARPTRDEVLDSVNVVTAAATAVAPEVSTRKLLELKFAEAESFKSLLEQIDKKIKAIEDGDDEDKDRDNRSKGSAAERLRVLSKQRSDTIESRKTLQEEINKLKARSTEQREAAQRQARALRQAALRRASIVVATLSSAGGDLLTLSLNDAGTAPVVAFTAVICDEAAQALEPATLIPLPLLRPDSGRVILVGDEKQLPATVLSRTAQKRGLGRSLFERLAALPSMKPRMLEEQYRMHPEIASFPSYKFYEGRLRQAEGIDHESRAAKFHADPRFPPLRFFDLTESEEGDARLKGKIAGGAEEGAGGSKKNKVEAAFIFALLDKLMRSFSEKEIGSIAVLTPYRGQVLQLRDKLRREGGSDRRFERVDVSTVDGFQGREADVVLFSCVRARPGEAQGGIGFLADVRRMNVALTRARRSLWIVGHAATLRRNADWAELLGDLSARNLTISVSGGPDGWHELLKRPQQPRKK